jgi:dihydrolipoamide dehydrogenase
VELLVIILGQVYPRPAMPLVVEYLGLIGILFQEMDSSLSKESTKVMKKQGMKFYVSQSTICRKKDLVNQS